MSDQPEIKWKDYIAELMRLNDWSPKELCERVGVSRSCISRWLSGETKPGGAAALTLMKLGGVDK